MCIVIYICVNVRVCVCPLYDIPIHIWSSTSFVTFISAFSLHNSYILWLIAYLWEGAFCTSVFYSISYPCWWPAIVNLNITCFKQSRIMCENLSDPEFLNLISLSAEHFVIRCLALLFYLIPYPIWYFTFITILHKLSYFILWNKVDMISVFCVGKEQY